MPMDGRQRLAGAMSGQLSGPRRGSRRFSDDTGVYGGPASRRNSNREVIEDFGGLGRPIGPEPNRKPYHERVTKPIYGGPPPRRKPGLGPGQGSGTLAASPTAPPTIAPPSAPRPTPQYGQPERVTKPVLGPGQGGTIAKPAPAPAPQPQRAMATGSAVLASPPATTQLPPAAPMAMQPAAPAQAQPMPAPAPQIAEGRGRLAEALSGQSGQLAGPPAPMPAPIMQRPDPAQSAGRWKQPVSPFALPSPWSGGSGTLQGGGSSPFYGNLPTGYADQGSRWWERY